MPPRVNVTSEQILEAAFNLTREVGYEALNARGLAKRIGCSTQPIFSRFSSMDALKQSLHAYLSEYFNRYVMDRMAQGPLFGQVGLAYINFAKDEPNLFRVLFMSDIRELDGFKGFFNDEDNLELAKQLSQRLRIPVEAAKNLSMQSWIFSHGIASMIATHSIRLPEGEIRQMYGDAIRAFTEQATQLEGAM